MSCCAGHLSDSDAPACPQEIFVEGRRVACFAKLVIPRPGRWRRDPLRARKILGMSYKLKAEKIAQGLASQLDYESFHKTGSLTQFFSLRSSRARAAFSWCSTCSTREKRFFTSRAVQEGIKLLLKKETLEFPKCPGVTFTSWLEKETEKILGLCQRARRSTAPAMDTDETQPWSIDEARIVCSTYIL